MRVCDTHRHVKMLVQGSATQGTAIQINWHLLKAATLFLFHSILHPCPPTHTAITNENPASSPQGHAHFQAAVSGTSLPQAPPPGKERHQPSGQPGVHTMLRSYASHLLRSGERVGEVLPMLPHFLSPFPRETDHSHM